MKIDIKTGLPELPEGFVWEVEESSVRFYSDEFSRGEVQLAYNLMIVDKVQGKLLARRVITKPAVDEEIRALEAEIATADKTYRTSDHAYRKSTFRKKKLRAIRDSDYVDFSNLEVKLRSLRKLAPSVPLSTSDILSTAVEMSIEESKYLGEVVAKTVSAHLVGEYPPLTLKSAPGVVE